LQKNGKKADSGQSKAVFEGEGIEKIGKIYKMR
jgi:hypothetical protein